MSFCGAGTFEDAIGAYPLNWRAVRNSILRSAMLKMPNPENPGRNSPYVVVSGHGGGRWYNFYAEFFTREGPEYRHLLVDGTSEPLRFYSCNPEHARSDANMEIRNSRYVTVYGLKGEGNYPELWVRDSDHVRVFGYGGNAAAYEHTSLFRIERTPNFLVANAVAFPRLAGVGSDEFYAGRGVDPNLWYMITDVLAGGAEIETPPLERPVFLAGAGPRGEPGRRGGLEGPLDLGSPERGAQATSDDDPVVKRTQYFAGTDLPGIERRATAGHSLKAVLRSDRRAFAFGRARLLILLFELIHAACSVDQLLTASEEGVAVGADFHADIALVSGTRLEHVATGANHIEFVISGVNTSFHFVKGTFRNFQCTQKCKPPRAHRGARGGQVA